MKYILKNKQVFNVIYSFIDSEFEYLDWWHGYDYTRDEETDDLLFFRVPGDDDNTLEYTKESWYTREFDSPIKWKTRESKEFTEKWLPKAPILSFYDYNFIKTKLTNFFGNYWKPVFEKWFRDKYPKFPVKTFIYK